MSYELYDNYGNFEGAHIMEEDEEEEEGEYNIDDLPPLECACVVAPCNCFKEEEEFIEKEKIKKLKKQTNGYEHHKKDLMERTGYILQFKEWTTKICKQGQMHYIVPKFLVC